MITIQKLNRADWLKDHGVIEQDVMWDEYYEQEYIMEEPMLMDEDENEDGRMRKVYLPENL